jgi:4-hydroxythreonine-4-phosphate dehydrogenase
MSPNRPDEADASRVVLVPDDPADTELEHPGRPHLVFDTDNRRVDAHRSSARLESLLVRVAEAHGIAVSVFLKVDSLLRGHLSSELGVLLGRGPVLFAPALPALGRSTIDGVVHAAGVPLHESSLWSGESGPSPTTIAEALAPLPSGLVDLETIRGDGDELDRVLDALARRHAIAICDSESAGDLDIIAAAALRRNGIQLAGASALGAALSRSVAAAESAPRSGSGSGRSRAVSSRPAPATGAGEPVDAVRSVLLVVGTASAQSRGQLQVLAESGILVVTVSAGDLLDGTADRTALRAALELGPVAVTIGAAGADRGTPRDLTSALALFIAPVARGIPLVLTGGDTARAVLDRLGVRWIEPLVEIEHGAVLSRADGGGLVVTRPGSFGGSDSLRFILERFTSHLAGDTSPPRSHGKAPS